MNTVQIYEEITNYYLLSFFFVLTLLVRHPDVRHTDTRVLVRTTPGCQAY